MADGINVATLSPQDVVRLQRTENGKRWDSLRDELRSKMRNADFRARRDVSIRELRTVTPGQVHSNAFMQNLSVQYANDEYIGLQLLPVLEVTKRSDSFPTYDKRSRIADVDDTMSDRSQANELKDGRGEGSYQVKDYGLSDYLPAATVSNEDPAFDEMMDLTEALMEAESFKIEKRCATVLTTAANFGSNTTALSGSDRWDSSAGGNPIRDIQAAIAGCWTGRGPGDLVGYCSLDVWNVLARHPLTLDLYKGTLPGLTKMDRLAQEFGLSKILVGACREDQANSGQTASYGRIWGKGFGVVRVARRASLRNAAFGYTIRMAGHPMVHQWFDPKTGVEGSYHAKVGVSEQQKIIAADTGFFIETAIS